MSTVHVVVPNDIDDPTAPSGGNLYDRQLCHALAGLGWSVREHAVPGPWPRPDAAARTALALALATMPDRATVLVDGLIASAVPEILAPAAQRLFLAILVHQPLGEVATEHRRAEADALCAAATVITTSAWTRRRLVELYGLAADRVHAAAPGVVAAPLAVGSAAGAELLCVAAVTPGKGHDVLAAALAAVADLQWTCVAVGSVRRDAAFAARIQRESEAFGIGDRLRLVGIRTGAALAASYAGADLLVLASRGETYGMVVTEALARGVPVLATATNGLPEALGRTPDGQLPGLLVPPDNAAALAESLRRWLTDPDLRSQLRNSARLRRTTLTDWAITAKLVSNALAGATTKVSALR